VKTEFLDLDALVRAFADEWTRPNPSGLPRELLADPILVLGPEGTTTVPRDAFLAAVAARSHAVEDVPAAQTILTEVRVTGLGDRMVLATLSWSFGHAGGTAGLVSDFLFEFAEPGRLRCVAYLPRTNILDHLPADAS